MDKKIWGIIGGIALALALLSPLVLGSTKKVKEVFEEAETSYKEARYEDALERYNKALEESKKFGVKTDTIVPDFQAYIHYKIAQCEQQLGNSSVALQRYRAVILNFPESRYVPDSYVGRGDIYFDQTEYDAAIEEYKRALETIEDAARREQINQKYQIALAIINPLPLPPPEPEDIDTPDFAALTEATFLRFKERFEKAATQYNAFASNYLPAETAVYALYWAGRCYHRAGLFQQSVDAFERLIDDYAYTPNTIEAYHGLAVVYFDWAKRDQDTSKCQSVIETVEKTEQEYADSRATLDQEVLNFMKEIKRNAKAMIESIPPPPPEPPPEEQCVRQGREHFERGELELAEEKVRKAERMNPDYQPAKRLLKNIGEKYYTQGLALLDQNRFDSAIVKFDKVINIDPNYKEAHFNLGVAYFNLHNDTYAANAVNKALVIDPEYEEALRLLGAIKEKEKTK